MNVTINGKKGFCNPDYASHGDGTYSVVMEDNTVYFATGEELGLVPETESKRQDLVVDGMGYEWTIPTEAINMLTLFEVRGFYRQKLSFGKIRKYFRRINIKCTSEGGQKQIHHYHLLAALSAIDCKLSAIV